MKSKKFLHLTALAIFALSMSLAYSKPLNVLFLTVDDMSCDSIGAFGCKVSETTPNIDKLAAEGLRFTRAHVQVGNCMPSRNVMQSGLYPHNNGVEGFYQVKERTHKILPELLKENGYFVGIKGKVSHTTPSEYAWDIVLESDEKKDQRNHEWFYKLTRRAIDMAKEQNKPFYLVMNINDPHKPFYGMNGKQEVIEDPLKPTKIFTPDEVVVPGFLPDTPKIRLELAHYYSSVRRADDCAGAVLKALKDSGEDNNTILMFLSDHGMPLPFAKTTVWHHGTRTPWIVRWPGVTRPGSIDDHHMISAVDFTPTILDILSAKHSSKFDGRSFMPLLKGEKQENRDYIIKEYNENAGGGRHPMRCVQTRNFQYIYNPWSDGTNKFKTATTGTLAYKEMIRLAATDPAAAERLRVFDYRDYEELYDCEKDPDNLKNLISNPEYAEELKQLRRIMEEWMVETGDHMHSAFQEREDKSVAHAYVKKKQLEADDRRKKNHTLKQGVKKQKGLIKMQSPKGVKAGEAVTLTINCNIPKNLKEQLLHVTVKDGKGQRIERKIEKVSGAGAKEITFKLPAKISGNAVQFAAFIGKDFPVCLEHINTGNIAVE